MGSFDAQLETLINRWLEIGDDPTEMIKTLKEAIRQLQPASN